MHLSAEECPHCGLTLSLLDVEYEGFSREVRRPHDAAGVLRIRDRKQVATMLKNAERAFPQLYFSVATVALSDEQQIRSYGYWLMNRGDFEERRASAREDGCVLIVVDVNRKQTCLFLGYLMDQYMREEEAFDVLAAAHPHLLDASYVQAFEVLIDSVKGYVKRLSKRAQRVGRQEG